jgi:hypothetical protein
MKNLTVKISALLLVLLFAEARCTKQQYRARSKRYPHDVPKKG